MLSKNSFEVQNLIMENFSFVCITGYHVTGLRYAVPYDNHEPTLYRFRQKRLRQASLADTR